MKDLFLIRGLPSSGKTTLANKIAAFAYAADDYFYDKEGNYNFKADSLHIAHKRCLNNVEFRMTDAGVKSIAVHNTFTTESEMKPYFELAEKYGYNVTTMIVESRHGNKNGHNVPDEIIDKMKNRFSIKL